MYYALIESHIRYADVVWGSVSPSEMSALQRLQDRALSIVKNAIVKDVWPARWLSVEGLIRYDRLVMMYKILHKICPESLWGKYQQRSECSAYRTRNILDLHIPRLNLEFTKMGFHYSGLKAWNDIPIDLREISSLHRFKRNLKEYLLSEDRNTIT